VFPSFAQRLLAFVCVEGIFFSGSFCAIYWLKNRGLMPGLATANEFISRDENMHSEFAISLYKMLEERIEESVVHSIFKEAVDIEKEFITESLPVSLIGMNCKLMSQYIEYVADRWLVLLGNNKLYNAQNPFGFMELISVNTKTNFFENTVSEYNKAGVGTSSDDRELSFDCDDF
jgi:ribonucleoside-diphosphate reductase beta chain